MKLSPTTPLTTTVKTLSRTDRTRSSSSQVRSSACALHFLRRYAFLHSAETLALRSDGVFMRVSQHVGRLREPRTRSAQRTPSHTEDTRVRGPVCSHHRARISVTPFRPVAVVLRSQTPRLMRPRPARGREPLPCRLRPRPLHRRVTPDAAYHLQISRGGGCSRACARASAHSAGHSSHAPHITVQDTTHRPTHARRYTFLFCPKIPASRHAFGPS